MFFRRRNRNLATDDLLEPILDAVAPYTMVARDGVAFSAKQALTAVQENFRGDIVECGVWRGGCAFAMLLAQKALFGQVKKPVWMFDSFQGLPPAGKADGLAALNYQRDVNSPTYFDNCSASIEDVRQAARSLGLVEGAEFHLVEGWFDATVPVAVNRLDEVGIALLRLDGDWYESTKVCLDHFAPLVATNGVVIIDDYLAWDGCVRAVHEYLVTNDLPYRIRTVGDCLAYFACSIRG